MRRRGSATWCAPKPTETSGGDRVEDFAGIALADLGLSGLLSFAVLMILVGALIPRPIHRAIVALMQLRIDKLEQIIDKKDAQLDRALAAVDRSADSLEAIQRAPTVDGDE